MHMTKVVISLWELIFDNGCDLVFHELRLKFMEYLKPPIIIVGEIQNKKNKNANDVCTNAFFY